MTVGIEKISSSQLSGDMVYLGVVKVTRLELLWIKYSYGVSKVGMSTTNVPHVAIYDPEQEVGEVGNRW